MTDQFNDQCHEQPNSVEYPRQGNLESVIHNSLVNSDYFIINKQSKKLSDFYAQMIDNKGDSIQKCCITA